MVDAWPHVYIGFGCGSQICTFFWMYELNVEDFKLVFLEIGHFFFFLFQVDQIESEIEQVYAGSRKKKLDRDVRVVFTCKHLHTSWAMMIIN